MRVVAFLAGVLAFVLFASAVAWLYQPEAGHEVVLATCESAPEVGAADVGTSPGSVPGALGAAAVPAALAAPSSATTATSVTSASSASSASAGPALRDVSPFYRTIPAPVTLHLCGTFAGVRELLVLPRLAGNAFEVRVDGVRRLARGAPERPANFWIQPQLVPLEGIGDGTHEVELDLYGLYDVGVRVPAYVTSWSTGGLRAGFLVWMTTDLVAIASGLSLGLGVLLLAYGFQRSRQRTEAVLLGVAALAAVLYVPDYVPNGGVLALDGFLLRRKLSLVGSFVFGAAITWGLELSTRARRRIGPFAAVVCALLVVATLASPGLVTLKLVSTIGAALFLPLSTYTTFVAARFVEPRYAWLWVFFGCATIQLTWSLATGQGYLFLFHFGMLAATLGGGIRMTSQLASMARELTRATHASLTDPLTGARNRAFCENLSVGAGDVVAMLDFDDFKQVNDRFGHERGDRLLVDFVRAARMRLRGTDHLVRMGGDEFLFVLRSASVAAARDVLGDVLEGWREASPDLRPAASFGLVAGRPEPLERLIAEADRAMYAAKGGAPRPADSLAAEVDPRQS